MLNIDDMPATELLQPGSRATFALLFAGPPAAVREFKDELQGMKEPGERLVDVAEASPQIQSSMDRAGRFLNLSALITVLLAAVAVAMAARRYARRHLDNVALMKCMGASQGFVLRVTLLQLVALAVLAALIGGALGFLAQEGLAWLLRDLVRDALPAPTAAPALLGLATAVTILVGLRAATDAAAEAGAAGARAAPQSGAAAAALRRTLRAGHRGAAGDPVLAGTRPAARDLRGDRHHRDARGALGCRLAAGAHRRQAARRRRCGLALRHRQPLAARRREHRAGGRLRPRPDGAAAARRGA